MKYDRQSTVKFMSDPGLQYIEMTFIIEPIDNDLSSKIQSDLAHHAYDNLNVTDFAVYGV